MVTRCAVHLLLFLLLGAFSAAGARAQDLGSTATAMGAAGAMETNPMRGGQQQMNRAAAVVNTVNGAAAAAPSPATATPAARPPSAASPATAPAAGTPKAPGAAPVAAAVPATKAPPPAEAAVDIHTPFRQSFFFTAEDIISIKKAMEQQRVTTPTSSNGQPVSPQVIPPVRRIALSGVVYKAADDWLIWINGQKVTPTVSMKEIYSIQVEREKVHLKWYDIGADKILDITMRPNETYDIVTGVLLPGVMK
ncbi:MAG: hypothetical protein EPN97_07215 [Alphaproteobacteria bacterium]|nr:MAG: hypothetical protein EPN97_07215 [Alphaproteobacteria bacterium]